MRFGLSVGHPLVGNMRNNILNHHGNVAGGIISQGINTVSDSAGGSHIIAHSSIGNAKNGLGLIGVDAPEKM